MEFLSTRELRLNPKQVWKRIKKAKIGVVTLNGKPQFILSSIQPNELEDILYLFNRVRAERAVQSMQRTAEERGLDKMSMEEIDKIVQGVRKSRKRK